MKEAAALIEAIAKLGALPILAVLLWRAFSVLEGRDKAQEELMRRQTEAVELICRTYTGL